MDKANKAVFDANAQCCDIMNDLIKRKTMEEIIKIDIPKGYEFAGVDDDKQQVVFTKVQPEYPKTYEECCEVLGYRLVGGTVIGYDAKLITSFQRLKVCRDAYWKIAGEQVGLGKPWKPEYTEGVVNTYYTIHLFNNKLFLAGTSHRNAILSFPTAEMRDAFYENFKDLIEQCKELL